MIYNFLLLCWLLSAHNELLFQYISVTLSSIPVYKFTVYPSIIDGASRAHVNSPMPPFAFFFTHFAFVYTLLLITVVGIKTKFSRQVSLFIYVVVFFFFSFVFLFVCVPTGFIQL